MKSIKLTRNGTALVDDADYDELMQFKWIFAVCGYASRRGGIYMHRQLLNFPAGIVDHINRNPLDNRRSNLRVGDKTLNSINRTAQKNNKCGHKGVYCVRGKWRARIKFDGRRHQLGNFNTLTEAIAAQQAAEATYMARW